MEIGEKIADNVALVGSDRLSGTGDCDVYAIQYAVGKVCLIDAGVSSFKRIYENICQVFKEKGKIKERIKGNGRKEEKKKNQISADEVEIR